MTRFLSVEEIETLHTQVISQSGGSPGLRDRGGLESAAAQPAMTFQGVDLYPEISDKAAARTIRLSMATNGLGTRQWKCFWFLMGLRSRRRWMSKNKSFLPSPAET